MINLLFVTENLLFIVFVDLRDINIPTMFNQVTNGLTTGLQKSQGSLTISSSKLVQASSSPRRPLPSSLLEDQMIQYAYKCVLQSVLEKIIVNECYFLCTVSSLSICELDTLKGTTVL